MSFGWRDVLNGLDEGLDVAKTIAAIIPGGQAVALGLGALDTVVSKANETYGVKSLPSPIQTSLDILEGVVKAKDNGSGVKVDNNAVISLLEVVSKSTGNGLDDKIICMVKAYIGCTGQTTTDINYPRHLETLIPVVAQIPAAQDMIQDRPVSKFADDNIQFQPRDYYTNESQKYAEPQQIKRDFNDDEDAHNHERCGKYL